MRGDRVRRLTIPLGVVSLIGAGFVSVTAAFATATPDTSGSDTYSGQSNGFSATAGIATPTIVVGNITDSDESSCSDFSAVINWGDLTTSTGTVADGAFGGCDISGSHTYAAGGSFPVAVDVSDSDEATDTVLADGALGTTELTDGFASVDAITGSTNSVSVTEGQPTGPMTVVSNLGDTDSSCDFTAVINWGDGTPSSPGTVNNGGCGPGVSGSHTYSTADEGNTFPLTVDITDANEATTVLPSGNTGTAELSGGTVTVLDATITPAAKARDGLEGTNFSLSLGTVQDANPYADPGDYSVAQTCYNDTGVGGSPTSAANKPADCVAASLTPVQNSPGNFTVNANHVFQEEGVYDVQTFITDGESPGPVQVMSTMDSYVTVADAPLTLTGVGKINVKHGKNFSQIVANFKDADAFGTTSDYFPANIDWGDGSPVVHGSIKPNGMGGWSITGTHTYAKVPLGGSYTIHVQVFETNGNASNIVAVVARVV